MQLKMQLIYDSIIVLLSYYLREVKKTYVHTKACTQILITFLLLIAPNWK